mmetsp:Transcript_31725/g.106889  ORF Transcript_31725/g.106889 Transcript_31725/m.106889 type:complete len:154 (+) Transcript_31725:215-676(+)
MSVSLTVSLQGPEDMEECGDACALAVLCTDGQNITLRSIREAFPFQGAFHFRLKTMVPGEARHVWLDLVEEDACICVDEFGCVELRALPLFEGDADEADWRARGLHKAFEYKEKAAELFQLTRGRLTGAASDLRAKAMPTLENALKRFSTHVG